MKKIMYGMLVSISMTICAGKPPIVTEPTPAQSVQEALVYAKDHPVQMCACAALTAGALYAAGFHGGTISYCVGGAPILCASACVDIKRQREQSAEKQKEKKQ